MIAFMTYVAAVSLLLVAAGVASEPLLRALRLPVRAAWIASMLGVVVTVPAALLAPSPTAASADLAPAAIAPATTRPVATVTPPSGATAPASATPRPEVAPRAGAPSPSAPRIARLLTLAWLLASLACLVRLLAGAGRVARLRRSCREGFVGGEPVLVSRDTGPAVLGALRHRIVVPDWVEGLSVEAQRLIVAHEREHVRARDPLLLHAALLLAALLPWNLALWLAIPRLREAIEIDCDARVLRTRRTAAWRYCRLLLEVGERTVAMATPLLALAEPATLLERRIEAMTTTRRLRDWTTLVPAAAALLLLAGAWRSPRPAITLGGHVAPLARLHVAAPMAAPVTSPPATAPVTRAGQDAASAAPARWPAAAWAALTTAPRIAAALPAPLPIAPAVRGIAPPDTSLRNEEALRRSAADHQARLDAITDSVIRNVYPELMRRPAGAPAFLALVLDDRDKLMRHKVSYDPALPNDLAAIMLKLAVDTLSARTLGVGLSASNPWQVMVGHAVEMIGPARGKSEYNAWLATPRSVRRVPYEHIVDSVARARTPDAFVQHDGTIGIVMLLREDGQLLQYLAARNAPSPSQERGERVLRRMAGDSVPIVISGIMGRLVPSKTEIIWGVQR